MMNFRHLRLALVVGLAATWSHGDPSVRAQDTPPAIPPVQLGDLLAPKAFRAAARRVLPTMVTIESFGGVLGAGAKKGQMAGIRMPGEGPTTGVILSSDGYIVTSTFNFLKKPPIITVVLPDGSRKVANLLGSDETRKLCLLKVEGVQGLPVPEFAPRSQIRVGQWAVALGVGFGDDEPAYSAGIISAVNRIQGRAVQTDANLSPANYGGPLIDLEGRIIGICVPLSPQSREVASGVEWYDSGIGFAVPLDGAEELLTRLKAGEVIKPGRLGIQAQPTPDQKPGAIVAKVMPGSAAETAGLKDQDRILKIDDEEVLDATHLVVLVNKHVAGEELKLHIRRGEEELDLTATLAVATDPPPMSPGEEAKPEDKPEEKKPETPKEPDQPPANPAS
jgi:serine protease Do